MGWGHAFKTIVPTSIQVEPCGFWDERIWTWSLLWKRSLRPQEKLERLLLENLLEQVNLSPSDHDSLMWSPSKLGSLTVKSVTQELVKPHSVGPANLIHSNAPKGFWLSLVPHRIEIFTWLVLLEKINSKDKLVRIGIIPTTEAICSLCGQGNEDVNHPFLHYTFSHHLWSWWMNIWGLHWAFPSTIRVEFDQWKPLLKGSFFKKIWCAIFFSLWCGLYGKKEMRDALINPTMISTISRSLSSYV